VLINASLGERGIVISVKDSGIGMDSDLQGEIFQRFKQGESGLRKSHRGHGLGLSIVHELVNQLSGNISIASRKGHGTIVEFSLPELENCIGNTSSEFGNGLLFTDHEEF
jgi:signal transduction histidine kinase